jgi:integrase
MSIFQEKDQAGRVREVVSRYWPDGKRFRRRVATKAIARNLSLQIEAAVANGTWVELRRKLTEPPPKSVTISEFADEVYMTKHCKVKNRRPEFKTHNLKAIKRILGKVLMTEVTDEHGDIFVEERKKEGVSNATINRGLSVLHNMLNFAVRKRIISVNPLSGFGKLPEVNKEPRFMTLEENRILVAAVKAEDHLAGVYCGILGETGLRRSDGLMLQWPSLDLQRRRMSKLTSKGNKVVHVPLSDYAIELLGEVTRIVGCPYVFVRFGETEPMNLPRTVFESARKKVGLEWVGFHDFRHYRGSQWAMRGVDLKTIQELLGHKDIKTTMRYAHFAPNHAERSILEAQKNELNELAAGTEAAGNK